MHRLADNTLLVVWDRGSRCDALTRALLLAASAPECAQTDPSDLTIGERDAIILRLRFETFGSRMAGVADCKQCAEFLEFDFDARPLLELSPPPTQREFTCADGLRYRVPDSHDLRAVADAPNEDDAALRLLQRLQVDGQGAQTPNAAQLAEVERSIAELDAAADLRIALDCPACGHHWAERLDIASWFWDEIEARVSRLLDDVHVLARAYGWSEPQILALGDSRRQAYLERCSA